METTEEAIPSSTMAPPAVPLALRRRQFLSAARIPGSLAPRARAVLAAARDLPGPPPQPAPQMPGPTARVPWRLAWRRAAWTTPSSTWKRPEPSGTAYRSRASLRQSVLARGPSAAPVPGLRRRRTARTPPALARKGLDSSRTPRHGWLASRQSGLAARPPAPPLPRFGRLRRPRPPFAAAPAGRPAAMPASDYITGSTLSINGATQLPYWPGAGKGEFDCNALMR